MAQKLAQHMRFPMRPLSLKASVALAALASLSGCISLAPKPPASLLTITSTTALPTGQDQSSATAATIVIQVPAVSQALAGNRIPVQINDTSIAYVPKAMWVEPPARLFARLVSDTVAAKTGRVVLSVSQFRADPGARLSGELRSFGIDATSKQAVVAFDGALIRDDKNVIDKKRFSASVPVATIDANGSAAALNQAANQVAGEVADWVGK